MQTDMELPTVGVGCGVWVISWFHDVYIPTTHWLQPIKKKCALYKENQAKANSMAYSIANLRSCEKVFNEDERKLIYLRWKHLDT
jgi:hypothetical protein